jgi:hypothetical protein
MTGRLGGLDVTSCFVGLTVGMIIGFLEGETVATVIGDDDGRDYDTNVGDAIGKDDGGINLGGEEGDVLGDNDGKKEM